MDPLYQVILRHFLKYVPENWSSPPKVTGKLS